MTSLFKKSLNAANMNIQVTTNRSGSRMIDDVNMDDDGSHSSGNYRERYRGGRSRGRGRGGYRSDYNQHDDRDNRSVTERLGDRYGYKGRGRDRRGRRGAFRSRGRGRGHYSNDDPRNFGKNPQWYQITIPYGAKAGKEFIIKSINDLLDVPFIPNGFRFDGQAAVFYVEMSMSSIEALKSINKRIIMPNGFKMMLQTKQSDPPVPKVIEGEAFEKMVQAMSGLYDTENKVLNLENFHKCEALKPDILPLNRSAVMAAAVNIIKTHIPELVGLNLSGNRLTSLNYLQPLVEATPNVFGLNLSENPDLRENELDRLKGWKLVEISLSGTPICKRNPDKANYLSAVRKKFPKIMMLDGESVPAPIGIDLDIDEVLGLPERKGNYFGGSQQKVTDFVREYYKYFDSDDRSPLSAAYHDDVVFSTSFTFNSTIHDKQPSFDIANSRNLLMIKNPGLDMTRMKRGKTDVMNFLTSEFCKTSHLLESLTLDVGVESDAVIAFTVTGLYEEVNPSRPKQTCRSFSRTFTTVREGEGLCIISELFAMSNVTKEMKANILNAAKKRLQAANETPETTTQSAAVPAANEETLIQQLMATTKMKPDWVKQCLETNGYDINKAYEMFQRFQAEGKIPPDAFQ